MQLFRKLSPAGPSVSPERSGREGSSFRAALRPALLWVVAPTVLAALFAIANGYTKAQLYGATTFIHVADLPGLDGPTGAALSPKGGSEVQLVRSLARRVMTELRLDPEPEFSRTDPLDLSRLVAHLGLYPTYGRRKSEAQMIEAVTDRLTIRPIEAGRILSISFVAQDPHVASRVAEGVAASYVALLKDAEREQASDAAALLSARIEGLRRRIAELRQRSARETAPPSAEPRQSLAQTRMAQLRADSDRQNAALSAARQKASAFREKLASGGLLEITDDAGSERLRRLVERRLDLRAELAGKEGQSASRETSELTSLLGELDREIRIEGERCAAALEAEAAGLAVGVAETERQVEGEAEALAKVQEPGVIRNVLRAEVQIALDELQRELSFAERTQAELTGQTDRVRQLAPALAVPLDAASDRITMAAYAASAIGVAMVVAVGGAFFGYRRPQQERPLATPPVVLGDEPIYGSFRRLGASDSRAFRRKEADTGCIELGDAKLVDALAAQLVVQSSEGRGLRILVTAAGAENQSEISTALARALAAAGRRVVIVETGARSGLAVPGSAGLAELLTSAVSFADVIHRDPRSRVHYIGPGMTDGGRCAADRDRLAVVVDALTLTYDFVVLASCDVAHAAPLTPFADAAILVTSGAAGSLATRAAHDALLELGIGDVIVLLAPRSAAESGEAHRAA